MLNIVYALCCIAVLRSQVVAKLIGRGGDRINSVVEKYLPTLDCDAILVTPSYDIKGKRDKKKWQIHETFQFPILCPLGIGRSALKFTQIEHLLKVGEDDRFASIMKSATCLITIAEIGNSQETSMLVDFISRIKVRQKYLLVLTPSYMEISFVNKTINFDVIIIERGTNS